MKSAFNREGKKLSDWDKINKELEKELEIIRHGEGDREEELKLYLLDLVDSASVSDEYETAFWNYDEPSSMPVDARCDYVYRPTYLITLIIINIINQNPEFMNLSRVEDTLRYALNACTGRNLRGAGYEGYDGMCANVLLFMKNGVTQFMRDWPLFSVKFEEVFRNALNWIEEDYTAGHHRDNGWGNDCQDIQKEIVENRHSPKNVGF